MEKKQPIVEQIAEKRVFDEYLKIDKATFKETSPEGEEITYDRFKLVRPDAVAVLVYNADEDTVILVKQHRYPIEDRIEGDYIEIVAGKMEGDEDPTETAVREVEEEIGYKLKKEQMIPVNKFFASAGYSSEMVHLYAAKVENADRVSEGGGVEDEHENIDIIDMPVSEFFSMVASGEIADAKTLMGASALWHLRNDHVVQAGRQYLEMQRMERAKITAEKVINEDPDDINVGTKK